MVKKLNLTLLTHPKLYKLHWLNEDGVSKLSIKLKLSFPLASLKIKFYVM